MSKINLDPPDFILMAVYMIAIIAWGVRHSRRQSAEGCFPGGRSMTWPVIGLSMMATCLE